MTENSKKYNQPSPKKGQRMSTNQVKKTQKQGKPNKEVQQSDMVIFLNYIFKGLNSIGEFILSDLFISTIQKVFQEHLNLLNYILKNLNSSYFWRLNLKYSLILTTILIIKGFFKNNFLSFELMGVISAICLLILKILDSKGDTLESSPTISTYNTENRIKNEMEGDDLLDEELEDLEFTTEDDKVSSNYQEVNMDLKETRDEIIDKPKDNIADSIKNIQKAFNQSEPTTLEPTKEILEKALEKESHLRQRLQYNQVMAQLQNRDLLRTAMKPLEKINRDSDMKPSESVDDRKYSELINQLGIREE